MDDKISRWHREQLIQSARQMRKEPTHAEALLWKKLRKKLVGGLKFRRQHIIHAFIVDFYCPQAKLVIEIDGSVHDFQEEYDQERDAFLEASGYRVVRFKNDDVEEEMDLVLAEIYDLCMQRIDSV